jgi:monoamine oxidase
LIEGLAGQAEIRFGSAVDQIAHDPKGVTVAWDGGEATADAAVITVPIGVLKAGTISFSPELPARTTTAIRELGAGLLDKVWLAFDEPFWDRKAAGFQWIDPRHPGRWGFWVNALPETGKAFLMTLTGGFEDHRLEDRSDGEVVTSAMRAVEAMFF